MTTMPDPNGTFDEAYAHQVTTTSQATVTYRWDSVTSIHAGPSVRLIRTVTSNHYHPENRIVLWEQVAAVFPVREIPDHLKDLTGAGLDAIAIARS